MVPVFYKFGKFSEKYPTPYYTIGETNFIDIATVLKKDEVLTIKNLSESFIPLQQSYASKVTLETKDTPEKQGLYSVQKNTSTLENIAFNYNVSESSLNFLNIQKEIKGNPTSIILNLLLLFYRKIKRKIKLLGFGNGF